jgi:hypothetical protein
MHRTQLYLDDHLWKALHARAITEETTISDLVRRAVREQYFGNLSGRAAAMQAFVGSRKATRSSVSSTQEVRNLRRGTRLDKLSKA